jgi:hypothetical protein
MIFTIGLLLTLCVIFTPIGCQYAIKCGPEWLSDPSAKNDADRGLAVFFTAMLFAFACGAGGTFSFMMAYEKDK